MSLSDSTVVPCTMAGLPFEFSGAEVMESDAIDCASHSRDIGVLVTGVADPTNPPMPELSAPDGICMVSAAAGGGFALELGLKVLSRFWADDLRRMLGRDCWPAALEDAMFDVSDAEDAETLKERQLLT